MASGELTGRVTLGHVVRIRNKLHGTWRESPAEALKDLGVLEGWAWAQNPVTP